MEGLGIIPDEWQKESGHWADNRSGEYSILRQWDEDLFLKRLKKAEKETTLTPDGNRAVMLCTTTDPYQTFSIPGNSEKAKTPAGSKPKSGEKGVGTDPYRIHAQCPDPHEVPRLTKAGVAPSVPISCPFPRLDCPSLSSVASMPWATATQRRSNSAPFPPFWRDVT